MNNFKIIHAPSDKIECEVLSDRNVPKGYAYLVPDNENFVEIARSRYEIEKDRNEWIRRYDNVLKGLRYWQAKEKER